MAGVQHQFKSINQIQSLSLLTAQYPDLFADKLGCIKNIKARIYIGDVRIWTDGRAIKKIIKRERHPLANLVDIKHTINGSKFFSKIDLKHGYHQVVLDENSIQCTAFLY